VPENENGAVKAAPCSAAIQFERTRRINGGALLNDRHPEIPSMRARRLQRLRPNRVEGPFVFGGKHKVSQGCSPADENAGLAYALRDDVL